MVANAPSAPPELTRPEGALALDDAPGITAADTGQVCGTVLDDQSRPLAGVRFYALWSRAADPNDRIPEWAWSEIHRSLQRGKPGPWLGCVWWRVAVSDRAGAYRISGLPRRTYRLIAVAANHLVQSIRPGPAAESPSVADFTANPLIPVVFDLQYPNDGPLPFTECAFAEPVSFLGRFSDDWRTLGLRLPKGTHDIRVENKPYGLDSGCIPVTFSPDGPHRIRLPLHRLPQPRVRLVFEGLVLDTPCKVTWADADGSSYKSIQDALVHGRSLNNDPRSDLYFRIDEWAKGPWFCGLVCGETCLVWTRFDAGQSDVDLELRVPTPDARQCIRAVSNRDVSTPLTATWQQREAVVWRETPRSWLLQAQRGVATNTPLTVRADTMGRLVTPCSEEPGGQIELEFARPCHLLVNCVNAPTHLLSRVRPWRVVDQHATLALEYAHNGFEFFGQPGPQRIRLAPGTFRITWDPGGAAKPLPPVELTITEEEFLVLTSTGMQRERA